MAKSVSIIKDEQEPVWRTKNGKEVPMSELTDAQLRKAKLSAQSKIMHYHNRVNRFDMLVEQLEEEAESRKLDLPDYDREYFKNEKKLKSALKK